MINLDEIEILMEGFDENNISSVLQKWKEIVEIRKKLNEFEECLKNKVKNYLKEKNWNKYMDTTTKISVSLTIQKREVIDKSQLKIMLSDAQYAQVIHISSFEKLDIITEEMRKRLRQIVKKPKNHKELQ